MKIRNYILVLVSLLLIDSVQNIYCQKKDKKNNVSTGVIPARRSSDYSIDKVHIPLRVKIRQKMTRIATAHAASKKIRQKKKHRNERNKKLNE